MQERVDLDVIKVILDKFKVEKKHNIYFGVDILYLAKILNLKKTNLDTLAEIVLNFFLNRIGKSGNLVIPVFHFDCIKKKIFNQETSAGQTGFLGKILLKKYFHLRTQHPIYSFLCFGNYANKLIKLNNVNATGKESPWKYFIQDNFDIITLGHHYVRSFTHVHYLENLIGVNYRFIKKFSLNYTDINCKTSLKKYSFYARKENICEFSGITKKCEKFFIKNNLANFYKYKDFISFKLNIKNAANVILEDMKKNSENFVSYIRPNSNNKENFCTNDNSMYELEKKYRFNVKSNL
jgi:aminoglycoside 3-N-acetyltransferase